MTTPARTTFRLPLAALGALSLIVAGCGDRVATPTPVSTDPASVLVVLDQVGAPDFTVEQAVHAVGADGLDAAAADSLRRGGFQRGAQVHFYRQGITESRELALSNGPVDVTATVAAFATAADAGAALSQLAGDLDGRPGATPISTGSLGDGGHAVTELSTVQGIQTVQITVIWRVSNLVNSLIVRGRYGGTRLDDALVIAHAQTGNEVAGGAPHPSRPSATSSPTG